MSTLATPTERPDLGPEIKLPTSAPTRLVSLDVFRGLTIAAMILVNDPGTWEHIYNPLEHATWNGWTHTDLVFPFFLFIVGVSMVFSFAGRLAKGGTPHELLMHTLKRGAIIFLIGLALNAFPFTPSKLLHIRYLGVLQRIGLVYAIGGAIYLKTSRRGRAITVPILLVGYWLLMTFVPIPGYGAGDLSPDGNLAGYIDRILMYGHTWKPTYDPEGFLSTIPAIGTLLLGTFVGELLRGQRTLDDKVMHLIAAGSSSIVAGQMMGVIFPINKNLWTSSFVMFTAGYAILVLCACYWLIDVKKWGRGWTMPFLVFGMNSILAYTFAGILAKSLGLIHVGGTTMWGWIYTSFYAPHALDPRNASLAFGLTFVLVCWLVMLAFYKKRVFLKV